MSKWWIRKFPRLSAWIRVSSFLTVAQLGFAVYWLRAAGAESDRELSRGIREVASTTFQRPLFTLLREMGPQWVGEPEVARVNGQRLLVASQIVPASMDAALDPFETHCRQNSGSAALAAELGQVPTERLPTQFVDRVLDPDGWFTSREKSSDGSLAYLVCLSRPKRPDGLRGLVADIASFLESGDLAAVGEARYVQARLDPDSKKTELTAIWTEGKFNVLAMFPESGDAPGSDSQFAPRPPEARRVFTGELERKPYAIRMYDTSRDAEEMRSLYRAEMKRRGWRLHPMPVRHPELDLNGLASAFSKEQSAVFVITHDTPAGMTGVSIVEMSGQGAVEALAR